MADELGHLSAEIALDINPFLTNQRVLETQINRTGKLLNNMENAFKSGLTGIGGQNIFKTQVAQLKMLSQQIDNYNKKFEQAKKDLANNQTVDNERALGTTATQLQNTALKYDTLRLSAARALQQQRRANTLFGRGATAIGDYGTKMQNAATSIRSAGSVLGSAAIGAGLYNAAQSAMHFKSEIQNIGPLLSEDGRITATVTRQLNEMSESSLKWSQQYGISTHSINNAMTELVRRGFTAKQTLGSMPAILNASRASGEDLGVVMQATASSIEMFGLKANTTAEQIKNTNRVTDVLTVAANKTASSFADISAAMTYVGPTAAQAHMSIEQIAAAIGALSNRGIEASTAGTTLRQVLSKLTTDTKANRANMQAIGVDIDEIKKKGVDLPKLIDQINNKLKNKTPTERMALLNAAFGKLGQGVMALFEKSNKSSKSAGQELRDLQNELERAGGTTKRIADQMNQTPEAKWNQFKQTMHATMIEVGGDVLPAFTGLMKNVQNLAQAFGRLDPNTQKAIVTTLAMYAAIKPLSYAVSAPIAGLGKLASGFQKVYEVGAKIKGGSLASALKAVDEAVSGGQKATELASGLEKVGSATTSAASKARSLSGVAGELASTGAQAGAGIATVATGAETAGTATATLGSALASTAAGVGVVGGALLALYGTYKLYTGVVQPFIEQQDEISKWGSVVGTETSESASRFKDFSVQATQAMDAAKDGVEGNASSIKDAFKGMGDEAQKNADRTKSSLDQLADRVGGGAGAYLRQASNSNAKSNQSYLNKIKQDEQLANSIVDEAAKHGGKMSADTRQELNNIQTDITSNYVKTLGKTQAVARDMENAIRGSFNSKLPRNQFQTAMNGLQDYIDANYAETKKHLGELKQGYNEGLMSAKQYQTAKYDVEKEGSERETKLFEGQVRLMRNQGKSYKEILNDLKQSNGFQYAQSIEEAVQRVESATTKTKTIVADTASAMSKDAKKAGKSWNDLILDPKTGKIKTNAQEVINDTAKTDKGWKQLKFIAKNAKISSNAKQMILEAAFASGRWNSMTFKQQEAVIQSKGGKEVAETLYIEDQWNKMNPKIQELIAKAQGKEDIAKALSDINNWNLLTPEQKKLIISEFSGFDKLRLELNDIQAWNALSPKEQKAIFSVVEKGGSLEDALKKAQVWDSLPNSMRKEIKLVDKTNSGINKIKSHLKTIDSFTAKPKVEMNTTNAVGKITNFSKLLHDTSKKQPIVSVNANTENGMQKITGLRNTIDSMTKTPKTSHVGVNVTGKEKLDAARDSQNKFNALPTLPKNNTMSVNGRGQVQDGTNKQKGFNGTPSSGKHNSMSTSGRDQVQDGTNKQKDFNGTHSDHKKNSMSASGRGEVADATAKQHAFMGLSGHTITNTIKTVYETIKRAITGHKATGTAGAWRFQHFAYGTPNDGWQGGPVVVGDGHRREIVHDPQVGLFATPATDTVMDLSKGSTVWRSVEAFESAMWHAGIKNYPHFANGTSQAMVNIAKQIPDDLSTIAPPVPTQPNEGLADAQMQNNELVATLIEMNQQLIQTVRNLNLQINVDGKQLAKAQVENNSSALNEFTKQTGMGFS